MDIAPRPSRAEFKRALRDALMGLYDPAKLAASPLIGWLALDRDTDPTRALLTILLQAIESRRPEADVPPQSNAWRTYHILRQRYVECFGQHDIAANLALSTRQLRRLHILAIDVLGDYLLAHYFHHLESLPGAAALHPSPESANRSARVAASDSELGTLGATPIEAADAAELIEAALALLDPLRQSSGVLLQADLPDQLPDVAVQRVPVHHAFLSLLTAAMRAASGGRLAIDAGMEAGQVILHLRIQATRQPGTVVPLDNEQIETARQLLRLSNGDLHVDRRGENDVTVTITLPTVADVSIVIVDDNVDALQLFQRYLDGTRYRLVATSDPEKALSLVEEAAARVVVLDLMLPRVDGWELLSRLREHPKTRRVPVIICSILPEEDLALMFGAVALLRKPVSQAELLAALDRALARPREAH